MSPLGLVAETVNPAHVWAHPNGRFLYASNWEAGMPGDYLSAFAVDRRTGKLTLINKVGAHGDRANQVVLDPSGKLAATVTYNSGTFSVFGVEPDGKLTEAIYTDQHAGKPLSEKQPGPKAHGIVFSKDSRFVYVAELGLDRVYAYHVDPVKRTVRPADPPFVSMNAGGSGPRRLQLHPNGKFLYVNHETDSKVSVFEVSGASLKQIQTLSTLPADHKGNNTTAEIQIDQTGKWLYVTNRGHDSMAHYAVDRRKGHADSRRPYPGGRPHTAQHHDRSDESVFDFRQPERREHRRVQDRSEDGESDADWRDRPGSAARRGVLRQGAVNANRRSESRYKQESLGGEFFLKEEYLLVCNS